MDKIKKISNIVVRLEITDQGRYEIQCSARYIIDGDPGNSGIVVNCYEVPDKLPIAEAAKYSKELFRYSLIKKGYIVEDGKSTE